MKKYQFKNSRGEVLDIFKGKGFTNGYVIHKALPVLNHKNEWDSDGIRLKPLGIEFKNIEFQLFMKQQKLEFLFDIKFKKEDLIDDNFVVGFYEYEKYKNVFNYAIIPLSEFIGKFRDRIAMPLLLDGVEVDEMLRVVLEVQKEFEEEKKQDHLRQKRVEKIIKEIENKRKECNVYAVQDSPTTFFVERFTAASKKTNRFNTKLEVKKFIESNERIDSKRGKVILCYDSEFRKKRW